MNESAAAQTRLATRHRILLVEDERDIRELVRYSLEQEGFIVDEAADADTALERIGGKFDGILRAHRMAADYIARDSVRYSIVAAEWPAVKQQLSQFLSQAQPPFAAKHEDR